jgi:metal-responsive CopG/Arc/MetJ family transcriptional regulator
LVVGDCLEGSKEIRVPRLAVKAIHLPLVQISGMTVGMKVAISLPDDVFAEGEVLARRLSISRSKLYARALEEYAWRHNPDALTAAMNAALEAAGDDDSGFANEAARRTLARSEW